MRSTLRLGEANAVETHLQINFHSQPKRSKPMLAVNLGFGKGGLEGRNRDHPMEQPWREVLLHLQGLQNTMALDCSAVRSYPQLYTQTPSRQVV
jgi:hypothetical protein